MIEIRKEQPLDITPIREVHIRAFGQSQEADIVDQLRQNCNDLLSFVAILGNQVVGHILFSPATIEGQGRNVSGMALAPMAVMPDCQRQGVGSELVRAGISKLGNKQCPFVLVLGHAEYYPRFGFEPASLYGIRSEWEVPDEAFMILVLSEAEMKGISGVAKYRQEFDETL
jgi:putative acetyltransferase